MRGRYFYVAEEVATQPADGECIANAWWAVHPEKGLKFYFVPRGYFHSEEPSPQCNRDRYTCEGLSAKLHPDCIVKQIPVVFLAHANKAMAQERAALKAQGAQS